jgi:hypothetical protein
MVLVEFFCDLVCAFCVKAPRGNNSPKNGRRHITHEVRVLINLLSLMLRVLIKLSLQSLVLLL